MSTHHGFLKEFPFIRVDAFDGTPELKNPYTREAPSFHLLTHAHTDHIVGLNSPDFRAVVYCTPATKHIIANTMEAGDRVRHVEFPDSRRRYKFQNLRQVKQGERGMKNGLSFIKTIEYDTPTKLEGPNGQFVTVTAIDANHCPGSAMFLIEGPDDVSVLITGDIRAEDWWVESLARHRYVSPYLAWTDTSYSASIEYDTGDSKGKGSKGKARALSSATKSLARIYVDTSCVGADRTLTSKEEAIRDLVRLIRLYPRDIKFFSNAWTWGYEELLKGISQAFGEPIHLDWYKSTIYRALASSDPLLSKLGSTSTDSPSRFHACERRWKCDEVWVDGQGCYEWHDEYIPLLGGPKKLKRPGKDVGKGRVVYVNPSEAVEHEVWKKYVEETAKLLRGLKKAEDGTGKGSEWPNFLFVSLSRHSTLPELQKFVRLFRPRSLYPLVMCDPSHDPGATFRSLANLFGPFIDPIDGVTNVLQDAEEYRREVIRAKAARGDGRAWASELAQAMTSPHEEPDDDEYFLNSDKMLGVRANVEGGEEPLRIVEEWASGKSKVGSEEEEGRKRARFGEAARGKKRVREIKNETEEENKVAVKKKKQKVEMEVLVLEDSQESASIAPALGDRRQEMDLVPATIESPIGHQRTSVTTEIEHEIADGSPELGISTSVDSASLLAQEKSAQAQQFDGFPRRCTETRGPGGSQEPRAKSNARQANAGQEASTAGASELGNVGRASCSLSDRALS